MSYRSGSIVLNPTYKNFCRPLEPESSQPENFRFQTLKLQVGRLVTHDTLLKSFHSDWEAAEMSDEAQQQWDRAFPGDIENRRLAHYLNAFAIGVDDARKVLAFIRSFLTCISFDNADTERKERISAFYDRPIDGGESALSRTMKMGDSTLLRDLIELCRGVPLAKNDSDMLRRFLLVYRVDTSESEEILAFFDVWKRFPPYSGAPEWETGSEERRRFVNCDLGEGITPLQSALELPDLDVKEWLVKLGAAGRSRK